MMRLSDFDFDLPLSLIAQNPTANRTNSRLLIDGNPIIDTQFKQLPAFLKPNDLLVLNNTKVMPARLYAQKKTGGMAEIMIERLLPNNQALAMIKTNRCPKVGSQLMINNTIKAVVLAKESYLYTLQFDGNIAKILDDNGHIPLPPYIKRQDNLFDKQRYQTVFAKKLGAVAAPTAGLHFDQDLLSQLKKQGIEQTEITLHIGLGTFLPVKTDNILNHKMHSEFIEVSQNAIDKINQAKARGGNIIAVGTTVVRALESCALNNKNTSLTPCGESTNIFIYPGFKFKVVDKLITNFHLPKSSLLMLVSAFVGKDRTKKIYQHAIGQQYRFFSYGDAMLLEKSFKQ